MRSEREKICGVNINNPNNAIIYEIIYNLLVIDMDNVERN